MIPAAAGAGGAAGPARRRGCATAGASRSPTGATRRMLLLRTAARAAGGRPALLAGRRRDSRGPRLPRLLHRRLRVAPGGRRRAGQGRLPAGQSVLRRRRAALLLAPPPAQRHRVPRLGAVGQPRHAAPDPLGPGRRRVRRRALRHRRAWSSPVPWAALVGVLCGFLATSAEGVVGAVGRTGGQSRRSTWCATSTSTPSPAGSSAACRSTDCSACCCTSRTTPLGYVPSACSACWRWPAGPATAIPAVFTVAGALLAVSTLISSFAGRDVRRRRGRLRGSPAPSPGAPGRRRPSTPPYAALPLVGRRGRSSPRWSTSITRQHQPVR